MVVGSSPALNVHNLGKGFARETKCGTNPQGVNVRHRAWRCCTAGSGSQQPQCRLCWLQTPVFDTQAQVGSRLLPACAAQVGECELVQAFDVAILGAEVSIC